MVDPGMQKTLILIGLFVLALGLAWPLLSRIPLGRLPGDIMVDRPGFKLFVPLTTMILVSVLLTLFFRLFRH